MRGATAGSYAVRTASASSSAASGRAAPAPVMPSPEVRPGSRLPRSTAMSSTDRRGWPGRAAPEYVRAIRVEICAELAGYSARTSCSIVRANSGASGASWLFTSCCSRNPLSGAVSTVTLAPTRPGSVDSADSHCPQYATQTSTWSWSTSAARQRHNAVPPHGSWSGVGQHRERAPVAVLRLREYRRRARPAACTCRDRSSQRPRPVERGPLFHRAAPGQMGGHPRQQRAPVPVLDGQRSQDQGEDHGQDEREHDGDQHGQHHDDDQAAQHQQRGREPSCPIPAVWGFRQLP